MLIDSAQIEVHSGDGGNGAVSFHRAKYVPDGGPDGGDGGRGGSVWLVAQGGLTTLLSFRRQRKYIAENGEKGGKRKCSGRSGADLEIAVPVGTVARDLESGRTVADLTEDGQRVLIARGGKGGRGNVHFANSVRQAPNFARAGEPGEILQLSLELKLLADAALVGLPNAGKSTLLSVVSAARPKIADYPFTTLEPSLGVVGVGDFSFVLADIPGLIEGAHTGAGLGLAFLRHIERTRLLIHVLDMTPQVDRDPLQDFDLINAELSAYSERLAARPQMVALNKTDLTTPERIEQVAAALRQRGFAVYPICAPLREGTRELMEAVAARLAVLPPTVLTDPAEMGPVVYRFEDEDLFSVEREGDIYHVRGAWIENLVASTNFDDRESLQYFQRLIRRKGVIAQLEQAGIQEGDRVDLAGLEFDFVT